MNIMLDYVGIFRELNKHKVNYIIVGGIAVNLYGIPRMTYDIDLLIDMHDDNLKNLLKLIAKWGFKPRAPINIMEFIEKEKRESWIKDKNMKAFCVVNSAWAISEIDIIIDSPIDYETAAENINYIHLKSITIPVISIDNLIEMKKNTGRKQDIADVKYLSELRNENK